MLICNDIAEAKRLYLKAVDEQGLDWATVQLLSVVSELYNQRAQDGRWRYLKLTPLTHSAQDVAPA